MSTETLRVLVVDDETGMRLAISRVLNTFTVKLGDEQDGTVGFDVQVAETGEEALEQIGKSVPDILLLDLKLPGISGLDVLKEVSERGLQTLTVMITAYATLETAIDATKRGAYDFLPKPFTPDELRVAVRRAVKHLVVRREARRLALEKRQVRFQFISVLGHELKAPLAAIEGYLQILRDGSAGNDPVVQAQVVERALSRAGGMRRLIAELLDLTRIESGQKRRELIEVDVREAAQSAIDTVSPSAREKQVDVVLHAPDRLPVTADRGELDILFNNLISNAVKYNRQGGRVDVSIEEALGGLLLTVADTGIGLSPEEASRLFSEFVRIKNDRTRGIPGTGLGLSIVKKLAQLYGGDVTVESQPGVGSTFRAALPGAKVMTPA
jgi:two-component system, sensor histidine kinase and response regulator